MTASQQKDTTPDSLFIYIYIYIEGDIYVHISPSKLSLPNILQYELGKKKIYATPQDSTIQALFWHSPHCKAPTQILSWSRVTPIT